MIVENATFAYYVPDPGVAADWYRDKLGFDILGDHREGPGLRWVSASPPGSSWQFIFSEVSTHGEGELAERFRAELGFAPHYMLICDDLEETLASLRERGVEIASPPEDLPFGRAAFIRDLFGNTITLADRAGWARLRST